MFPPESELIWAGSLSMIKMPGLVFVKPLNPARPEVIVNVFPLVTSMFGVEEPLKVRICAPAIRYVAGEAGNTKISLVVIA